MHIYGQKMHYFHALLRIGRPNHECWIWMSKQCITVIYLWYMILLDRVYSQYIWWGIVLRWDDCFISVCLNFKVKKEEKLAIHEIICDRMVF